MLNIGTANNSSIHVRFKKQTSPDFFSKISQSVLKNGMKYDGLTSVFRVHPTILKFLLITNWWQTNLRIVAFALSNKNEKHITKQPLIFVIGIRINVAKNSFFVYINWTQLTMRLITSYDSVLYSYADKLV